MDKLEPWIRPEKGSSMDLTLWQEAWNENDLDAPEDQPDLVSGPPCPETPSSSSSGRSDLAYSPNRGLHSPFAAAYSEATSSRIQPRAQAAQASCTSVPRAPAFPTYELFYLRTGMMWDQDGACRCTLMLTDHPPYCVVPVHQPPALTIFDLACTRHDREALVRAVAMVHGVPGAFLTMTVGRLLLSSRTNFSFQSCHGGHGMDHQADRDVLFVLMHSSGGYIHLEACPIKPSRHSRPVPSLHPRLHLEWWTEGLGGDDEIAAPCTSCSFAASYSSESHNDSETAEADADHDTVLAPHTYYTSSHTDCRTDDETSSLEGASSAAAPDAFVCAGAPAPRHCHKHQRRHPAELAATQRLLTRDLLRRAGVGPSAVSAPPEPPSHPPTPSRPSSALSGMKTKLAKLLVKAPRSPLQRAWKAFVVFVGYHC